MTDTPMTNRQVEDAAICLVLEREHSAGRAAVDTRGQGALADIEGDWLIEVKAFGRSARGEDLWLETRQVHAALNDPERFHLVLVENIRSGVPRIIDIHGDQSRTAPGAAPEEALLRGAVSHRHLRRARRRWPRLACRLRGSEIPQGFRRRSVPGRDRPTSTIAPDQRFRRSNGIFGT